MKTTSILLVIIPSMVVGQVAYANSPLPGTQPQAWPEAVLPDRLMDGAHRFVERQIQLSVTRRRAFWPAVDASDEEWADAIKGHRDRLKAILGVVDKRLAPRIEYFGNTPERTIAPKNSPTKKGPGRRKTPAGKNASKSKAGKRKNAAPKTQPVKAPAKPKKAGIFSRLFQ